MEKAKIFLRNKKNLALTIVVVLALSLPFIVNQVLQQQKTQQHADAAPSVNYKFNPSTSFVKPNTTFPVDVTVNTGTNDIGSMEFTIKYDKTLLQPISASAESSFVLGKAEITDAGYHVILLNETKNQITGASVAAVKVTFKALKDGFATVTIDNSNDMKTTASLFYTFVPSTSTTTKGVYMIAENVPTGPPITQISGTVTPSVSPTSTPTPTPTASPGQTRVKLTVVLPGIGNQNGNNPNPAHPARRVSVEIFNSANQNVATVEGELVYSKTNGDYEGTINLGNDFTSGSYYIKVKFDNTLWKRLPGIVQITKGSDQNAAQKATLISGDVDGNNKLTIDDYNMAVACFQQTEACTPEAAALTDNNDNGTVDLLDYVILRDGFATINGD